MQNANPEKRIQYAGNVWAGQAVQEERLDFYNKFLADLLRSHLGKRILEIGVGLGNIAEFLIDYTEAYVGIDVVKDHILYTRERFRGRSFEGYVVDVERESELDFIRDREFDSIVSVNCFEHLKDDLSVLVSLSERLRSGTHFAFLLPAHHALYGALDIQAGHFRRYGKKDLESRCQTAGFKVEGMRYVNLFGALGWFLVGKIFRPDKSDSQVTPEQMNWRWKMLYGAVFLAKYPLMAILALEKQFEFMAGLSLLVWGIKK